MTSSSCESAYFQEARLLPFYIFLLTCYSSEWVESLLGYYFHQNQTHWATQQCVFYDPKKKKHWKYLQKHVFRNPFVLTQPSFNCFSKKLSFSLFKMNSLFQRTNKFFFICNFLLYGIDILNLRFS